MNKMLRNDSPNANGYTFQADESVLNSAKRSEKQTTMTNDTYSVIKFGNCNLVR